MNSYHFRFFSVIARLLPRSVCCFSTDLELDALFTVYETRIHHSTIFEYGFIRKPRIGIVIYSRDILISMVLLGLVDCPLNTRPRDQRQTPSTLHVKSANEIKQRMQQMIHLTCIINPIYYHYYPQIITNPAKRKPNT